MAKQTKSGMYVAGHVKGATITAGATGRQIRRWVSAKVPNSTLVVLSDAPAGDQPGIYYNLSEGELVFITHFTYGLDTVADDCTYELVACSAVAGGGTAIPLTAKVRIVSGAAIAGHLQQHDNLARSPIAVPYSAAALSISIRVDANDASTSITCGWMGYSE